MKQPEFHNLQLHNRAYYFWTMSALLPPLQHKPFSNFEHAFPSMQCKTCTWGLV